VVLQPHADAGVVYPAVCPPRRTAPGQRRCTRPRTNRTRRVPRPRTNRTRRVPRPRTNRTRRGERHLGGTPSAASSSRGPTPERRSSLGESSAPAHSTICIRREGARPFSALGQIKLDLTKGLTQENAFFWGARARSRTPPQSVVALGQPPHRLTQRHRQAAACKRQGTKDSFCKDTYASRPLFYQGLFRPRSRDHGHVTTWGRAMTSARGPSCTRRVRASPSSRTSSPTARPPSITT